MSLLERNVLFGLIFNLDTVLKEFKTTKKGQTDVNASSQIIGVRDNLLFMLILDFDHFTSLAEQRLDPTLNRRADKRQPARMPV